MFTCACLSSPKNIYVNKHADDAEGGDTRTTAQAVEMQGLDDPFAQFAFQAPAAKRYRMTRGGFTR